MIILTRPPPTPYTILHDTIETDLATPSFNYQLSQQIVQQTEQSPIHPYPIFDLRRRPCRSSLLAILFTLSTVTIRDTLFHHLILLFKKCSQLIEDSSFEIQASAYVIYSHDFPFLDSPVLYGRQRRCRLAIESLCISRITLPATDKTRR